MRDIEYLLSNEPDAWECGAYSADDLVAQCCSWLLKLPELEIRVVSEQALQARRALWLVDRLCRDNCPGAIVDLDQPALSATLHYIRARRDPSLILKIDPRYLDFSRACDAWVSAYTPGPELLAWYDLGEHLVTSGSFWGEHTTLPVDEYSKFGADPAALMPLISSPTSVVSIAAARHILRRLAIDLPMKPGRNDELLPLLRDACAHKLADAIEANIGEHALPMFSNDLFLMRAQEQDLTDVAELVADPPSSQLAVERLVDLVQEDCPELWQAAMHVGSFSDEALRMFCEWVGHDQSDLLLPHIGDADPARAAIAFHAYLYLAPADAVRDLVQASPHDWMKCAWDRFQFAPEAVRPPRRFADIQDAENDMRLHDPFNRIGY